MHRGIFIPLILFAAGLPAAGQTPTGPPAPGATAPSGKINPVPIRGGELIDGIAARIENDIITESEVRELAAVQELVNGKAESREALLNHLIDQWSLNHEAAQMNYTGPKNSDVQGQLESIEANFPSHDAFEQKLSELGLTMSALERELKTQEFLAKFEEYRFRAGVTVSDKDVESYYSQTLVPDAQKKGQAPPPLADVSDQIRSLLTEQEVTKRADDWLVAARSHLQIEVMGGSGCSAGSATC